MNVETVKSFLSAFALEKLVADIIFPYIVKVVFEHFFCLFNYYNATKRKLFHLIIKTNKDKLKLGFFLDRLARN